jgi:hypothetical protein
MRFRSQQIGDILSPDSTISTDANKADEDRDGVVPARRGPCRGRIQVAGIAGPECLRPLRQRRLRAFEGPAAQQRTAEKFFDPALRSAWVALRREPYDFLVQSSSWRLGAVSISILRQQFDKTYVAVAFDNQGRAVTLNFIVVNGPEGWVIADVESPHDSLRMFLAQHRN